MHKQIAKFISNIVIMSSEEESFIPKWRSGARGGSKPKKPSRQMYVYEETQLPPEEQIKSVSQLASEALKLKHWLFNPKTKEWYTPEELIDQHGRISTGNEAFLKRLEIKDPIQAIKQADTILEDIRKRSQAFALRVIVYFSNKAK